MNANPSPSTSPEPPALHRLGEGGSAVLNYFTQSSILRQIGYRRLAKLLKPFDEDLKAARLVLPEPDPEDDDYFADLANALSIPDRLPGGLRQTLMTIEIAASPENEMPLWRALHRRAPGVSVSQDCALDRALELWFVAPEEFSQFITPKSDEGGFSHSEHPRPAEGRGIKGEGSQPLPLPQPSPSLPPVLRAEPRGTQEANWATGEELLCPSLNPQLSTLNQPRGEEAAHIPFVVSSISDSPSPNETDDQTYERLARLSPGDYDRARQAEATRLGIRKETLDTEVAKRRPLSDDAQARAVKLPPVEPWPTPVDGAEALDQVSGRFTHHLVLPPGAADVIALWNTHAFAAAAFVHSPRLNLSSPEPGCGKTTTLDLIATMTPRSLRTENLTAPVLFRLVDQHQPTLLLDEVDSYLTQADELRGLLNAGHKRGACAYRCEGESNSVRAFNAFAPAVLAGIGDLPGTLRDRSITIVLLPAEPDQIESRFDSLHTEIESVLCRKLARWTQDHFAILQACDPPMPSNAFNRLADNWRPLFAIAQTAGGDWPRRALEAFNHLTAKLKQQPSAIDAQLLLGDIRQIFAQSGATRMSSTDLLELLRQLPERPWRSTMPGSSHAACIWLGHQLHRFGIKPRTIRVGPNRIKGYESGDFTDLTTR